MSEKSFEWSETKQLSVVKMLLATFLPSLFAFAGFHFVAPLFINMGMSKIHSWLYVAIIMLFIFVLVAVLLLAKEAKDLNITLFKRMCFKKVSLKLWIFAIAVMIISLLLVALLTPLIVPMIEFIGFKIPDYTPLSLIHISEPTRPY